MIYCFVFLVAAVFFVVAVFFFLFFHLPTIYLALVITLLLLLLLLLQFCLLSLWLKIFLRNQMGRILSKKLRWYGLPLFITLSDE